MPASFPASVKTFTRKRDLLDIVLAADINLVYDEVTAIQTALGATPQITPSWTAGVFTSSTTSWSSVKARIQNIEYGVYAAFTDRVKSSGGSIILPDDTSTVNLTLRAKLSQTADLLRVENSAASIVTRVNSSGQLLVNNAVVPSVSSTDALSNKTISGANNTLINIPTSAVIVSGSTDIGVYVNSRPTVYYQGTLPTSGIIPGSIWVDSSQNVEPFDASALLLTTAASPNVNVAGFRRVNASPLAPTSSDGANGDVWLQYI
jgi:hypothetical protein